MDIACFISLPDDTKQPMDARYTSNTNMLLQHQLCKGLQNCTMIFPFVWLQFLAFLYWNCKHEHRRVGQGGSPVLDKTTIWSPGWKTVFSSGLMLMELSLLW